MSEKMYNFAPSFQPKPKRGEAVGNAPRQASWKLRVKRQDILKETCNGVYLRHVELRNFEQEQQKRNV